MVSILRQRKRCYTSDSSSLTPFSEQWCKQKKDEIYKNGFPAVFQDMSKMKDSYYFANTNSNKVVSFHSLNNTPGIYMITNKTRKKFYIGMSTDLKKRFYYYLDENSLNRNRATRISKALLKYGLDKFSIAILEFTEIKETSVDSLNSHLREREDFFIRVFKPQYNIKRSKFNMDTEIGPNYKVKIKKDIPTQIKNLLDNCLNPALLGWNLVQFKSNKDFYSFVAITPKCVIKANSKG